MNFKKQVVLLLVLLTGCDLRELPKEKYFQFNMTETKSYYKNDSVYFFLENSLKCPLRYYVTSSDSAVDKRLRVYQPVTLQQATDTLVRIAGDSSELKNISIRNFLGDMNREVVLNKMTLPFSKGEQHKIVQGYNGSHSHYLDDYSRNSLDFDLKTNDTVCAADDGFVVGVIKDYKDGGSNIRWRDYGNFITIYHPRSGVFTQYFHLTHNGSFVAIGDSVASGEPIGLAGETGWTDVEHLHFQADRKSVV